MSTRLATLEDTQAIISLLGEMRGADVQANLAEDDFAKVLNDKNRAVLLVESDDQPLGMAVCNLVFKLPKVECRVDEVIVSAAARGKGLGTELMQACETWAWGHGADVIEFTSRPSREAANHLYQKLDYQIRETNVYQKKRGEA